MQCSTTLLAELSADSCTACTGALGYQSLCSNTKQIAKTGHSIGDNSDLVSGFQQPSSKILNVSVRGAKFGQDRMSGS